MSVFGRRHPEERKRSKEGLAHLQSRCREEVTLGRPAEELSSHLSPIPSGTRGRRKRNLGWLQWAGLTGLRLSTYSSFLYLLPQLCLCFTQASLSCWHGATRQFYS